MKQPVRWLLWQFFFSFGLLALLFSVSVAQKKCVDNWQKSCFSFFLPSGESTKRFSQWPQMLSVLPSQSPVSLYPSPLGKFLLWGLPRNSQWHENQPYFSPDHFIYAQEWRWHFISHSRWRIFKMKVCFIMAKTNNSPRGSMTTVWIRSIQYSHSEPSTGISTGIAKQWSCSGLHQTKIWL